MKTSPGAGGAFAKTLRGSPPLEAGQGRRLVSTPLIRSQAYPCRLFWEQESRQFGPFNDIELVWLKAQVSTRNNSRDGSLRIGPGEIDVGFPSNATWRRQKWEIRADCPSCPNEPGDLAIKPSRVSWLPDTQSRAPEKLRFFGRRKRDRGHDSFNWGQVAVHAFVGNRHGLFCSCESLTALSEQAVSARLLQTGPRAPSD